MDVDTVTPRVRPPTRTAPPVEAWLVTRYTLRCRDFFDANDVRDLLRHASVEAIISPSGPDNVVYVCERQERIGARVTRCGNVMACEAARALLLRELGVETEVTEV